MIPLLLLSVSGVGWLYGYDPSRVLHALFCFDKSYLSFLVPVESTTVKSVQPRYLGDSCSNKSECMMAISGSTVCSSYTCSCSDGFTAYKDFACLQGRYLSNLVWLGCGKWIYLSGLAMSLYSFTSLLNGCNFKSIEIYSKGNNIFLGKYIHTSLK